MTPNEAYAAINGLPWSLHGVAGHLHVERVSGLTEIIHAASATGRRSAEYRKNRRALGDDYSTTITQSDTMDEVFQKLHNSTKL